MLKNIRFFLELLTGLIVLTAATIAVPAPLVQQNLGCELVNMFLCNDFRANQSEVVCTDDVSFPESVITFYANLQVSRRVYIYAVWQKMYPNGTYQEASVGRLLEYNPRVIQRDLPQIFTESTPLAHGQWQLKLMATPNNYPNAQLLGTKEFVVTGGGYKLDSTVICDSLIPPPPGSINWSCSGTKDQFPLKGKMDTLSTIHDLSEPLQFHNDWIYLGGDKNSIISGRVETRNAQNDAPWPVAYLTAGTIDLVGYGKWISQVWVSRKDQPYLLAGGVMAQVGTVPYRHTKLSVCRELRNPGGNDYACNGETSTFQAEQQIVVLSKREDLGVNLETKFRWFHNNTEVSTMESPVKQYLDIEPFVWDIVWQTQAKFNLTQGRWRVESLTNMLNNMGWIVDDSKEFTVNP